MTKRRAAEMEKEMDDESVVDEPAAAAAAVESGEGVADLISKMCTIPDSAKDVFLWELLCNASNALSRLRCESMVDVQVHGADLGELFILIVPDDKKGTLTIIDNGIGMGEEELKKYLCGIPKRALEKYSQNIPIYKDNNTVPDFVTGDDDVRLGFHSAYMVADKVVVTTNKTQRRSQFLWTGEVKSNGCGYSCTIARDESAAAAGLDKRRGGTAVTLFLNKKHHHKYTHKSSLINLTKKYVEHLMYPVYISDKIDVDVDVDPQNTKEEIFYKEDIQKAERDVPIQKLKTRFENLRAMVEKTLGSRVEGVDLDDRVPELANYLSSDKKRFVINPRSPITEEMRQMLMEADHWEVLKPLVDLHFEACLMNILAYDLRHDTNYYYADDLNKAMFRESGVGLVARNRNARQALFDKYLIS